MTPGSGGMFLGVWIAVLPPFQAARRAAAASVVALCALCTLPVLAQTPPAPAATLPFADATGLSAIPPNVLFVRAAGFWQKDDKSGTARLILARIGPAGSHPRLFVQWLTPDAGGMKLVAQQEITEVVDWRLRINDLRLETTPYGAMTVFDATPLPSTVERRYYLEIGPPEETRFYAQP